MFGCALALALFLVRPRVGRLRGRVAQAIAQAVGRNVEISSIHLRLVPRPGFELDNLVVHDDAAFGAEPLIRAPQVTAWLRVGALLRGRLEIASLSLDDASLNVCRNAEGKWNVEDLVERASHTVLAPTAASAREAAHFPYIEATHARVNFKVGDEKTHFALTNAEFALWQDSQDSWSARLRAAPVRTDSNLTDTGVIDISGTWERSAGARQTPVQVSFQWKQAQVGQLSRLFYGTDKAWRGGVLISGTATGTPGKLQLNINGSVDDFRHRDVIGGGNLHLATHCSGELNLPARAISTVDCVAPTGVGFLEIKGSASGPRAEYSPFSVYDFWLVGSKVPAVALLGVVRHISAGFQSGVSAAGEINASIEISRQGIAQSVRVRGGGAAHDLQIATQSNPVQVATLPFVVGDGAAKLAHTSTRRHEVDTADLIPVNQAVLLLGPANLGLGNPTPVQVSATISADGYAASAKGEATVERLLQTASALSIPAPGVSANGDANVDLMVAGSWNGPRPMVTGTSQLRSVRARIRGLNSPIEIASAHLAIAKDAVRVQNLTALAGGMTLRGSLVIPRPCTSAADCAFQFTLHAPTASIVELNALLNPSFAKRPWYTILPFESQQPAFLLRTKAAGKLMIDDLVLGKEICSDFSTDLDLNSGVLTLANMSGSVLGGHATGDWKATFSRGIPAISGAGIFDNVDLGEVAQLMHNGWIAGNGNAQYRFATSGKSWPDLLTAAEMRGEFSVKEGTFPHLVLVRNTGPLRTNEFGGTVTLLDGKFSFENAKLRSAGEVYSVKGTAAMNGTLDLRLMNQSNGGFNVTGTLFKTVVSSIPTAQAALKQ